MRYLLYLLVFLTSTISAQSRLLRPSYDISMSGWYSNNSKAPFWVVSNQYAKNKNEQNNTNFNLGLHSSDKLGAFQINYGVEGDARRSSLSTKYWVHEIWSEIQYKKLYLKGGRKVEYFGIGDSLIGSGGASWSSNARPMPRVSVGFTDFVDIPYLSNTLSIKGCIEHGWFEYNRYVHSPYLHHKNLFLRINISKNYHFYWGIDHFAQWGGVSSDVKKGKLPATLSDYVKVFVTQSGSSNASLTTENSNKLGNHLGSFYLGFRSSFDDFTVLAYQQTFFEDGSGIGFKRKNRADGIWGLSLSLPKQQFIKRFVYEYFNTMWQSGKVDGKNSVVGIGGADTYYNNGIYKSGWTYYGYVIGSPFISSPMLLGNERGTINDRVIAHYASSMGNICNWFEYRMIISHSRNYGLYSKPFEKVRNQTSFLIEAMRNLPLKMNIKVGLQFALDKGDLIGDHFAFGFCVRANGILSK